MLNSRTIVKSDLEFALIGGTILGGGGGGSMDLGRASGEIALEYGNLELVDINSIDDATIIITASAVGAPAAPNKYVRPKDYVRCVELLEESTGLKVGGIITNENGGAATINGWIQSAVLGIPLIDAPCNGRAHPTGKMGSMGLNDVEGYYSSQAFSGGNPMLGNKLEGIVKGELGKAARLVRESAVHAGGLVAVARNPVEASYIKKNAAVGGITHAIETGKEFNEGLKISPMEAIRKVTEFLGGEIVVDGEVKEFDLVTTGGFDVGKVVVLDMEMTFWNEYMTLEFKGNRLYTFPDLIMTFNKKTGMPVTTAEISKGDEIVVMATKKENLKLGAGMYDEKLLREVEPIINKEIINHIK
jgi:hypothetical protein